MPDATTFDGGEGTWFDSGVVFFTTKGDKKVWAFDTGASTINALDGKYALLRSALRTQ